ncbi:MAG: tRNA dimethylallyltransferase [Parcubacteria bacterium C7867-001]|nr:MAG: tRNA dimethylallyltransferase [Parcubacteria bacterium C7867-001]
MRGKVKILAIIGPTGSGKSARAVEEALARNGEIISVDSRQVYRGLDIGTEKMTGEDMDGIPHHLIDIRNVDEIYSAGDFVVDAQRLIEEISSRGKLPILAGGTHFYFDALLNGIPQETPASPELRASFEPLSNEELYARIEEKDPERAAELDPNNRRRLIRALEIIETKGPVPKRVKNENYEIEWIVIDPPKEELLPRLEARLKNAFSKGLITEVERTRATYGDARLNELGLEYRIVGEFLRGERSEDSLIPALTAKLWQYAKHQKKWIRKLSL